MNKIQNIIPLIKSIHDDSPVSGLTHIYYRYPARFSPNFASSAIKLFTKPGDIVYDPFMGGGTTLVEAMRLYRKGIGTDLNSLAVFVSKAKTAILTDNDISALREWIENAQTSLKLNRYSYRPIDWISQGYQKNISGHTTWPIRKTIELAIRDLDSLKSEGQRCFARCLLLRTAQWAVDCRKYQPSANDFRKQLIIYCEDMIGGALALRRELEQNELFSFNKSAILPVCLHLSAKDIIKPGKFSFSSPPKLILTSPPYPGVHVLYHRWQVNGRKETAAPYWIANCLDGNGESFYTFGNRKQKGLEDYFDSMRDTYKSLYTISSKETLLVQLIAFSYPEWQLPLFLEILKECGFEEVHFNNLPNATEGRSWRIVPNRKFYADNKGNTPSSREVLLIHNHS